ncbi:MAG: phosphatidate cytidylyltransferase [Rickettsiales bacterium]|nr:phosphatidate cytidylyltransferase [Rickettsiales bacterium]
METLDNNPTPSASRWQELSTRIASASVLMAVFLVILWQGGWWFTWLVVLAALIMSKEWNGLTERDDNIVRFTGLFYVSVPCACLIWLRGIQLEAVPSVGLHLVLFLMVTVWATDTGAYFIGRQFGKTKMFPAISPKKTWEGLGGGVGFAIIGAQIIELIFPVGFSLGKSALLGFVISLLAQTGDFLESWMKRRAGVKDSGTLIPGHGGLLDRIDGLIFSLPFFALVVHFSLAS